MKYIKTLTDVKGSFWYQGEIFFFDEQGKIMKIWNPEKDEIRTIALDTDRPLDRAFVVRGRLLLLDDAIRQIHVPSHAFVVENLGIPISDPSILHVIDDKVYFHDGDGSENSKYGVYDYNSKKLLFLKDNYTGTFYGNYFLQWLNSYYKMPFCLRKFSAIDGSLEWKIPASHFNPPGRKGKEHRIFEFIGEHLGVLYFHYGVRFDSITDMDILMGRFEGMKPQPTGFFMAIDSASGNVLKIWENYDLVSSKKKGLKNFFSKKEKMPFSPGLLSVIIPNQNRLIGLDGFIFREIDLSTNKLKTNFLKDHFLENGIWGAHFNLRRKGDILFFVSSSYDQNDKIVAFNFMTQKIVGQWQLPHVETIGRRFVVLSAIKISGNYMYITEMTWDSLKLDRNVHVFDISGLSIEPKMKNLL